MEDVAEMDAKLHICQAGFQNGSLAMSSIERALFITCVQHK